MSALRVIDTGLTSARWNIAVTAALADLRAAGRIGDTLRFHRYPRSVLLGRTQDPKREIDEAYCRANGVEVARRVTGGGTVYMAPGILAWDIVAARGHFGGALEATSRKIGEAVAQALRGLGLAANFAAPNAVTVSSRKICGMAGFFDGAVSVHQGALLADFDRADMASALRIDASNLPVVSVREGLGHMPAPNMLERELTATLSAACGLGAEIGTPSQDETDLAVRLLENEIGRDDFVWGMDARHPERRSA